MYSIERPKKESPNYVEYLNLISGEWPEGKNNDEFTGVPAPILIYLNSHLAGGVSFTLSASPEGGGEALWVNTLFVKPKFRGRKLASKLIAEVQDIVEQHNISQIYVYTSVPQFYIKYGWACLSKHGKFSVLKSTKNT